MPLLNRGEEFRPGLLGWRVIPPDSTWGNREMCISVSLCFCNFAYFLILFQVLPKLCCIRRLLKYYIRIATAVVSRGKWCPENNQNSKHLKSHARARRPRPFVLLLSSGTSFIVAPALPSSSFVLVLSSLLHVYRDGLLCCNRSLFFWYLFETDCRHVPLHLPSQCAFDHIYRICAM